MSFMINVGVSVICYLIFVTISAGIRISEMDLNPATRKILAVGHTK